MRISPWSITAAAVLFACGAAHAGNITIKGSDTMVILNQKWAEGFMKSDAGTQLQVTGGGSGTGIAALLNGTTDIAASSRSIKERERSDFILKAGTEPSEISVALDGIGIYVHSSNPVASLSLQQLSDIYTRKISNWKDVGGPDRPIVLYSRENNSGTYAFFKEHVLKDADFAASAQAMAGTAALINAVTKDAKAIGYGGIGYASGVRIVPVSLDGKAAPIAASLETVVDGSYPISRPLYLYFNPASKRPEVRNFIAWILGKDGQKLAEQAGYYPMPDASLAAEVAKLGLRAQPVQSGQPVTAAVATPDRNTNAAAPAVNPIAMAPSSHIDPLKLAQREASIAEREAAVAMREMRIAEREADVARRETGLVKDPNRNGVTKR